MNCLAEVADKDLVTGDTGIRRPCGVDIGMKDAAEEDFDLNVRGSGKRGGHSVSGVDRALQLRLRSVGRGDPRYSRSEVTRIAFRNLMIAEACTWRTRSLERPISRPMCSKVWLPASSRMLNRWIRIRFSRSVSSG